MASADVPALAYDVIVSPVSMTTFWSPPTMTSAPPGSTVASFTRNAEEPLCLFNFADAVILEPVVLASDNPMMVAVVPAVTVGVIVEGLPDVPMFGVTNDLNAIYLSQCDSHCNSLTVHLGSAVHAQIGPSGRSTYEITEVVALFHLVCIQVRKVVVNLRVSQG